jgi:hypothetical protein
VPKKSQFSPGFLRFVKNGVNKPLITGRDLADGRHGLLVASFAWLAGDGHFG